MQMSLRAPWRVVAAVPLVLALSACSMMPWSKSSSPSSSSSAPAAQTAPADAAQSRTVFSEEKTALTPASSTADNMVRLDATTRSGCTTVTNIDRSAEPVGDTPQLWTAHTCHGDLVYEVRATKGPDGPVVTVLPAGGSIDKPANPHFTPAKGEDTVDTTAEPAAASSEASQASDASAAAPAPAPLTIQLPPSDDSSKPKQ
jgi:hypothetical protein